MIEVQSGYAAMAWCGSCPCLPAGRLGKRLSCLTEVQSNFYEELLDEEALELCRRGSILRNYGISRVLLDKKKLKEQK